MVSPYSSRKVHYPEIGKLKVMKFLPNSFPEGDLYSYLIPNQKNNPNANAKTYVKKKKNLHQD